ncbi:1,2-epoxyphenylacetyl-CoA isomerase [compost metagenome]
METLLLNIDQGVATITLNRPAQKNALNPAMRTELISVIDRVRRDESVRVVVLTGAGQDFCSGGDIRTMTNDNSADASRARISATHEWLEPLITMERPVIVALDGVAYGGGFGIALAGDVRLATARARLCCSFLRVGLVPDCGVLYTLPRIVGSARAKALLFSTEELSGTEAKEMGLVHEICEPDMLQARAQAIARALAAASPVALGMTKRGLDMSLGTGLRGMLEYEATAQGLAMNSQGHREAVQRFMSKQKPAYTGWPQQP